VLEKDVLAVIRRLALVPNSISLVEIVDGILLGFC
jgi:hypothetical protein